MLICFPLVRCIYLEYHTKKKFVNFSREREIEEKRQRRKKRFYEDLFMNGGERNEEKKLINIRFLLLPFLYHLITWNSWCSKNKIEMHFSFVLELIHIWAIFIPKKMLFHSQENTRCFQSTSNSRIFVRIFRLILIIWQMKMQKIIDNLF